MITGSITLFVLVFGLGAWSLFTQMAGAVVGSGVVEVETKRQVVQHATGGVIGKILVREGDLVALQSRVGEISLRAKISERIQPGVVYTTFHHPSIGANVVTTDNSDWATNCPEYKVTAVQVRRTNHYSDWQEKDREEGFSLRRIAGLAAE